MSHMPTLVTRILRTSDVETPVQEIWPYVDECIERPVVDQAAEGAYMCILAIGVCAGIPRMSVKQATQLNAAAGRLEPGPYSPSSICQPADWSFLVERPRHWRADMSVLDENLIGKDYRLVCLARPAKHSL